MAIRKKERNYDWLHFVVIFVLGLLIASNVFMFLNFNKAADNSQNEINSLKQEINKLKADDVALAQAINNLTTQLQALGIIKLGGSED